MGGKLGLNDFERGSLPRPVSAATAWGITHPFRVIALDQPLGLAEGASRSQVDAAMNGHVLGSGELTATFVR